MQTPRARFTVGSLRAVFSACAAMRAARHPPPTSRNCPGQLAGAYYGAAALPQRWVERLFFRPLLLAAADALAELAYGRSLRCVPQTQVVMHTTTYCGKSRKKARRRSDRSIDRFGAALSAPLPQAGDVCCRRRRTWWACVYILEGARCRVRAGMRQNSNSKDPNAEPNKRTNKQTDKQIESTKRWRRR
jgi:hypothetical protein